MEFIQQIDQLSRLKIDESMKFSTHLYRDIPSKYLEQYLPKYRKIIIRQKTKLNEFETLVRDVGYIELALHELIHEKSPMHYEFDLYDPDNGAEAVLRVMVQHRLIPIRTTTGSSSSFKSLLSFFKKPKDYNVSSRHDKNQELFDILVRKDSTGRMSADDNDDDDDDDVQVFTNSDFDLTSKLDFNRPDSFFVDRNASTTVDLMPYHHGKPSGDDEDLHVHKKTDKKKKKQQKQRSEDDDDDFILQDDGLGSIGFTDADFRIAELNSRVLPSTPSQSKQFDEEDRQMTPMSVDLMQAVEDIEYEMNAGGYNRLSIVPGPIDTSSTAHDDAHRISYSLSYSHSPTSGVSHGRRVLSPQMSDDDSYSDLDYAEKLSDRDRNSAKYDAAVLNSTILTAVTEEGEESSEEDDNNNVKAAGKIDSAPEQRSTAVDQQKHTVIGQNHHQRATTQRSSSKRLEGKKSESESETSFGVSFTDVNDL